MNSDIKNKVKQYYGAIAKQVGKSQEKKCCCSSSCCDSISDTSIIYKGQNLNSLPEEAVQASLGCANPLLLADLKKGETVLDLGSGGGIDVLMASKHVGESGKVYGLDMTDEMLALANKNKERMGVTNVEFLKGYIEDIPLPDESVDVIMSNCVINLSEDKEKALTEAFRVLKPGGRLAIADIISLKDIPQEIRMHAETWCGCLGGSINADEYRNILERLGFTNIEVTVEHIYSKEAIKDLISDKSLDKNDLFDLTLIDGAFAGAYIKAVK